MAHVIIYTTRICPYCVQAKSLLKRKKVAFEEIDVTMDSQKRAWLVEKTGRRTVPQIFIDGVAIGGSDELHALDRQGMLDKLLAGSAVEEGDQGGRSAGT
jgi:glutaredoxin 3